TVPSSKPPRNCPACRASAPVFTTCQNTSYGTGTFVSAQKSRVAYFGSGSPSLTTAWGRNPFRSSLTRAIDAVPCATLGQGTDCLCEALRATLALATPHR